MKNTFYTDFDTERLRTSQRSEDYRTPFQIDRDRLIHSSEFRRLQAKTQVFLPGEYDFYRTRLTHSIEVAQIGRSICNYFKVKFPDEFNDEYHIDSDLVESICLSHDMGHPPFGHAGERTLNKLMMNYGGFEGNAQTLRILTETIYRAGNGRRGLKPTRALLDGIMKYKRLFSEFDNPVNHFIYDYQKPFLDFVFNNSIPTEKGADLNNFRSIECQIMDWADDTAYAVNDIVDSITAGFLSVVRLSNWGADHASELNFEEAGFLEEMISWIKDGTFKQKFGSQIGTFVEACRFEKRESVLNEFTNRYKYRLEIDDEVLRRNEFYKRISLDLVFNSPQLHQMEFKAGHILRRLFDTFYTNYVDGPGKEKLLPEFSHKVIAQSEDKTEKIRLICDQLSGMTDNYAVRTYRRLFEPDYGGMADLV